MFVYQTRFRLLLLERYALQVDPALLAHARGELLPGGPGHGPPSFRSGFLLGLEADAQTHPACLRLAEVLRAALLTPLEREHGLRFALSFYKLTVGQPPESQEGPFYEGPHLDSHPELRGSRELLRVLVNLSRYPRRFLYGATDRWLLADQGVRYGRRDFEMLTLPESVERRVVSLPGRTSTSVHALRFLASAVPHVGLNDQPEHFLLSFEALTEEPWLISA